MAKKRKKRRGPKILLLIAIAVLIAGFVVRRTLMPKAIHYLAYRPPDNPAIAPAAMPSEDLSASDRKQLDDTLKNKAR
ncbi:MAG: hypothetical protein WAM05_17030 [Candidatus Binataceae bacterium]|jgi:hypothetical protein